MFHELTFRAMNSDIQVLLESPASIATLETPILEAFWGAEQRFSRFLPTSECSYLNTHSGQLCIVSSEMLEVLEAAQHYQALTNGAFNISVGHALQRAGYTQSFETLMARGSQFDSHELDLRAGALDQLMPVLNIDAKMKSFRMPDHHQLDFGGIVKSWTAQQAAANLRHTEQVPRGLIHAGGDVEVWGGSSEREPWIVGIDSPDNHPDIKKSAQEVCVHLRAGGVATSSTRRRRWVTREGEMHHLIDTRSMRPSQSDVVQTTVVGPDLVACEVWAKVLCMLGTDEGVPLFRQRAQGMEALLYQASGEICVVKGQRTTNAMHWSGLEGVKEL
ncbi:FAD:protein FMN transferase [Paenibacillus roseipurpureus]|uniref:FAD:protein FMN transferase n=1 Tax=Paenibacillus roseopurpureus TaxID=2918901 RepID=A0AA96LLV4_9BACL|nr:FAD:protein FMN transferase [Paenibacillus sp. MBLB1832]WNR43364.1 FAD:protein FMN transferase [Paenibacillus sp. MBLB1832]